MREINTLKQYANSIKHIGFPVKIISLKFIKWLVEGNGLLSYYNQYEKTPIEKLDSWEINHLNNFLSKNLITESGLITDFGKTLLNHK